MSRKPRIPKYRHYKPKNLAVVRIGGKDHYLGAYDSAQSWEQYHRLAAEMLSSPLTSSAAATLEAGENELTIDQLVFLYWQHAKDYYVYEGQPTAELTEMKLAIRPLRKLFATTPAAEFGPKRLKLIRQHMIDVQDLSRGVINQRINRIKRVFRWAVEEELIPSSVFHGLQAVGGLRFGRTQARETDPIRPVADVWIGQALGRSEWRAIPHQNSATTARVSGHRRGAR